MRPPNTRPTGLPPGQRQKAEVGLSHASYKSLGVGTTDPFMGVMAQKM